MMLVHLLLDKSIIRPCVNPRAEELRQTVIEIRRSYNL